MKNEKKIRTNKKRKDIPFIEKLFAHYWFLQDSILLYFIQGFSELFILL